LDHFLYLFGVHLLVEDFLFLDLEAVVPEFNLVVGSLAGQVLEGALQLFLGLTVVPVDALDLQVEALLLDGAVDGGTPGLTRPAWMGTDDLELPDVGFERALGHFSVIL
jgi:hypothetical protein